MNPRLKWPIVKTEQPNPTIPNIQYENDVFKLNVLCTYIDYPNV